MGKKEAAEKEAKEKKEAADKVAKESAEKEAMEAADEEGDEDSHDDADKDKELIKKMLDEHVGKEEDMDKAERETMESLAHEAYQAHKEMGASESEAMERAGHAIKLARHMASKQSEADAAKESEADDDDKEVDDKKDDKKESACDDDKKESEAKMESKRVKELERKLLEANGKIAAMENSTKKDTTAKYVETKLRESGQPNSITKRFIEAAGDLKSPKDFDSKWKVFLEGVKGQTGMALDWSPIAEKSLMQESEGGKGSDKKGLDFSQAVVDED